MPEADDFDPPDEYDVEIKVAPGSDAVFEKTLKRRLKENKQPSSAVQVVSSGSNYTVGIPGLVPPTSPNAVLSNLVSRDESTPTRDVAPPSPTILGLQRLIQSIANHEPLQPHRDNIEQVVSNMPEKSELINAFLSQIDSEFTVNLVIMRDRVFRVIMRASERGDITVQEGMVLWRLANEQLALIGKKANEKPVDGAHAVEKIDHSHQRMERESQRRWEGTTPQGRELIRKRLWEIKQEMSAKVEVTETYTETVEEENEPEPTKPLEPVTLAHPP